MKGKEEYTTKNHFYPPIFSSVFVHVLLCNASLFRDVIFPIADNFR